MKILVVNEERNELAEVCEFLGDYGRCESATHENEAVEKFARALELGQPYNMVAIDADMYGCTGLNILHRLNKEESRWRIPKIKKVVMSNAADQITVVRALKEKCDAFIVKPLSKELIDSKIGNFKK